MTNQMNHVFDTILVAYDGSTQSLHAVDIAFSLAEAFHSKLLIFAVIRLPKPAIRAEVNAILDKARDDYEQNFESLRERAKQKKIELEAEVAVGHPAQQIVNRAGLIHASLIIIGGCEISTFRRWMLGSIFERALCNACCPVMVIQ